jgi:hypothetical protein
LRSRQRASESAVWAQYRNVKGGGEMTRASIPAASMSAKFRSGELSDSIVDPTGMPFWVMEFGSPRTSSRATRAGPLPIMGTASGGRKWPCTSRIGGVPAASTIVRYTI